LFFELKQNRGLTNASLTVEHNGITLPLPQDLEHFTEDILAAKKAGLFFNGVTNNIWVDRPHIDIIEFFLHNATSTYLNFITAGNAPLPGCAAASTPRHAGPTRRRRRARCTVVGNASTTLDTPAKLADSLRYPAGTTSPPSATLSK